jgi:hypothetical protein
VLPRCRGATLAASSLKFRGPVECEESGDGTPLGSDKEDLQGEGLARSVLTMSHLSADARFLRKIFAASVAATVLAGSVSGIGAVRVVTQRPAQGDARFP